ncbi:MAG TPA: translocation/assembly module TamB domain-containing protein [Allosphingosinicella sp.]|jgi:translocation and assembly module TamB|nr:translocation/assembly module TamB domain-containing protein [Allosphingosinicella sp.]
MAAAAPGDEIVTVRRRRLGWMIAKWAGIVLATLVALLAAFLLWLNSEAGHRFIVDKINAMETSSGLKIHVARIEGSIFSRLTIHGLSIADPRGTFASAARAELDYRPLAYLVSGRIDIRDLDIPEARLMRSPRLRPGDPNAPILPDISLDVARLHVGRLAIDPAVTGRRHLLSLDGRATIADGRAQVTLDAGTLRALGLAGGDRLHLVLDAVPSANRLDVDLNLSGPGDGFLAGLIGTDRAVAATVNGRGSWASWQGRARATLAGEALADLAVTGRNGSFTVDGNVRPGLVLQGAAQRLAEPARVNLVASLDRRRADIRFRMRSRVLALAAEGRLDLGANSYQNLRIAGRLLEPGAIAPNLAGRDVSLTMILNGAFASPNVLYELRAASLAFGGTTIEGLRALGNARVRAGDIVVPVSARATRILGFDAVAGGTIADVRLDGQLGIAGTRLVSDNMILRSDRIQARLALAFDLAAGRYLAAVQGRVDNYLVDGVGLFAVTTNLDMTSGANGFGLRGRVAARSLRLTNETVRNLFGGVGTATADIVMDASGVIRVSGIHLAAPKLRVRTGGGVYRPDGTIDLSLAGDSSDYGPLAVRVTGRANAPRITVAAARPGYGLVNLTATVRATGHGWALEAEGNSEYGRFHANIVIRSSGNRMAVAVTELIYAGITFRGDLARNGSAPFVGELSLNGQGLTGTVTLDAAGRGRQLIRIAATANGARTPGDHPIIVQRGRVQVTITLPADDRGTVDIVGGAELAGLASGDLFVQRARADFNLSGGRGTAQLFAEGRRGVSFRVAASGQRQGDRASLAMQGQVNNIPFRFEPAAQLRRVGADWLMLPATISFPQGRVRLAGRYGDGLVIQTRLDNLDLTIVNAFSPGLGIGGRATGSLDFSEPAGGSFPRAEARLNVTGFTRTGIAVRSSPVDLFIAGNLTPEGGAAGAIIRRGGAIIGRAQIRLQPLGPAAGSWRDRLLAAPLAGGVRYNGPADVPMSFASLPGHQLTGPLGLAADFTGRLQNPQFSDGVVRANNLTYVNETYGTRITNLAVDGRFSASELSINRLTGRAGNGTINGSGTIGLSSAAGYPIDLRLNFQNARLARSDDLGATATGNLQITNNREGSWIRGALDLGEVRYQIVQQAAAEIPQLAGVRRRGEPLPDPNARRADARVPSVWQLDIELRANNRIYVSGMGMESEWRTADLHARGTTATLELVGQVRMIRGTLGLAGRRFRFDRGEVTFEGARPPRLDLVATADIESVEVGIVIAGSSLNPQISFTSSPSLPQDEVVSRILFGSSVTQISALQAVQLAASLNSLRPSAGGGLNPLGRLRSATGIDRLRIIDADTATGRGTAVAAGMYLSDNIYVEIITDAKGYTATQIEISLTRALSLLSQFGSNSGTNVNLRYNRDY